MQNYIIISIIALILFVIMWTIESKRKAVQGVSGANAEKFRGEWGLRI